VVLNTYEAYDDPIKRLTYNFIDWEVIEEVYEMKMPISNRDYPR
jgi:hypothetical protein